ncbi:hypothetical protein GCM10018773_23400 [Streptomyces candidus]|nr:hypothetical protein GCM10018773_23400 [Streptomyces candidus]
MLPSATVLDLILRRCAAMPRHSPVILRRCAPPAPDRRQTKGLLPREERRSPHRVDLPGGPDTPSNGLLFIYARVLHRAPRTAPAGLPRPAGASARPRHPFPHGVRRVFVRPGDP